MFSDYCSFLIVLTFKIFGTIFDQKMHQVLQMDVSGFNILIYNIDEIFDNAYYRLFLKMCPIFAEIERQVNENLS